MFKIFDQIIELLLVEIVKSSSWYLIFGLIDKPADAVLSLIRHYSFINLTLSSHLFTL